MVLLPKTAQRNHFLDIVKQFLAHKRCVLTLVYLATIHKMSVIKRIRQNLFNLIWLIHLATFGLYALRVQVIGNICKTAFIFCVHFKDSHNKRSLLLVYLDSLCSFVIVIAKRCITMVFATPHLLAQTSFGVFRQI